MCTPHFRDNSCLPPFALRMLAPQEIAAWAALSPPARNTFAILLMEGLAPDEAFALTQAHFRLALDPDPDDPAP